MGVMYYWIPLKLMINRLVKDIHHDVNGTNGDRPVMSRFNFLFMFFWGILFFVVFFSGTGYGATPVSSKRHFGVDYLWYGINQYYKEENVPTALNYINDLQVTSLRVDIHWHFIEPSRNSRDWRMTDLIVNTIPPNVELLFTVYSSARWAIKDIKAVEKKSTSNFPKRVQDYYDFIFALADRYKGRVKYYQIENEVYGAPNNFWSGTSKEYLELLKTASLAIRKANPDAKILPASVALGDFDVALIKKGGIPPKDRIRYRSAIDFLDYVFENGCNYFDIADIHLYYTLDSIPHRLNWFKELLSKNRCEKPIWVTETGGLEPRAYKDTKDDRLQAEDLVKRFVLAFGNGAQRVFWLAIHKAKDREHPIFGDIRLTYDPLARNKKPAYYTLKLLIQKIEGFMSVSRIPDGYKFVVGGKPVLILWADKTKMVDVSPYLVSPVAKTMSIVTDLGPDFTSVPKNKEVYPSKSVPVSVTPIFVEE